MKSSKPLPTLRGEPLYIPFVGAIIERTRNGKKQIVVQIRDKESDSVYSGAIEIPGGKFRAFEDIFATLRREVKEECGLEITFIDKEDKRIDYPNRQDISSEIIPFCVTQMRHGPFIGMIFLCTAKGKLVQKTNETKKARWINVDELRTIINEHPERIYTAFLAPLKKYLQQPDFDIESLRETAEILAIPGAKESIEQGMEELRKGQGISLQEFLDHQ